LCFPRAAETFTAVSPRPQQKPNKPGRHGSQSGPGAAPAGHEDNCPQGGLEENIYMQQPRGKAEETHPMTGVDWAL